MIRNEIPSSFRDLEIVSKAIESKIRASGNCTNSGCPLFHEPYARFNFWSKRMNSEGALSDLTDSYCLIDNSRTSYKLELILMFS